MRQKRARRGNRNGLPAVAGVVILVCLASGMATCGALGAGAGPTQHLAATSSSVAATPESIVVPPTACDDASLRSRVEASLREPTESPRNSLLAFPSEVDDAHRAQQAAAWADLSAEDRAFQLCLRLVEAR